MAPLGLAFTMAEILLSLTIIGVVAAIILPSLTGDVSERTWNTQRIALYSRLSQAVALMPQVRGYGDITLQQNQFGQNNRVSDNGTEVFLSSGLSKVLKINNICGKDNLADCGLAPEIVKFDGAKYQVYDKKMLSDFAPNMVAGCANHNLSVDTGAAAFETANGESILVYYNPICQATHLGYDGYGNLLGSPLVKMCANFVYDLNGKKGPNTIGKDVGFMSLFYSADSILVAPMPLNKNSGTASNYNSAREMCQNIEARLPNKEELMSIALNEYLLDEAWFDSYTYLSSSLETNLAGEKMYWTFWAGGNYEMGASYLTSGGSVRCVKR